MNYLHHAFSAQQGDAVEVTLDHAANVQLLDATNYGHYRSGRPYRYRGGYVTTSPFSLTVPHTGHWHVVIDLGGKSGRVNASARLIPASQEASV